MDLLQPLNRRLFLNNCKLIQSTNKKTGKPNAPFYTWYTNLGKGKGIITCKCWNTEHDMTKLKYIERCVFDLTSHEYNDIKYYELKIISYAPPKVESWKVVQPAKKEMVNVNDELPPMEEFGEQIIDTQPQNQVNIQEIVDNYGKENK